MGPSFSHADLGELYQDQATFSESGHFEGPRNLRRSSVHMRLEHFTGFCPPALTLVTDRPRLAVAEESWATDGDARVRISHGRGAAIRPSPLCGENG